MADNTVDKYSPPSSELIITDRSMETVLKDLGCEVSFFQNKKVLSVGEGLSGFANGLAEEGIDITAVDPVYANPKVLNETAPQDYESISADGVFKSYRVNGEEYNPPKKDKVKIIAADSETLPFEDGKFDVVVANRVYEHVDMTKVLPEMTRVLSGSGGELRMGGIMLHCIPEEGKLLSGIYQKNDFSFFLYENPGLERSLKTLNIQHPEISVYLVVGNPSRYSIIYNNTGAHMVKNLIFVKGDNIPEINNVPTSNEYEGKLYKVNPANLQMAEVGID